MSEVYQYSFNGEDVAALEAVYINDIGDEDICSVKLGLFFHQKNILSRQDSQFTSDSMILYRRLHGFKPALDSFQLNLHLYGDENAAVADAVGRFRQGAAAWDLKKSVLSG
jgi:hypothetical protein